MRRGGMDGDSGTPRTVWMLWLQGVENAPYLVQRCHESWVEQNPGWRVLMLDESTLPSYLSIDYSSGNLSRQLPNHRANVVRLELLARFGGVWADGTCFCVQPLDDWLPAKMSAGFFAFERPGADRLLSNWFLAARPGNLLVTRLLGQLLPYWADRTYRTRERPRTYRVLRSLLVRSPRTRSLWFSKPVRDWLRICPYFAFHYMFERLVREDPVCAEIWLSVPKVSADGPRRLRRHYGLLSPLSDPARAEIDAAVTPVYKTSWKDAPGDVPQDTVLGYLLASGGR
jgi:hypothetical protein